MYEAAKVYYTPRISFWIYDIFAFKQLGKLFISCRKEVRE